MQGILNAIVAGYTSNAELLKALMFSRDVIARFCDYGQHTIIGETNPRVYSVYSMGSHSCYCKKMRIKQPEIAYYNN